MQGRKLVRGVMFLAVCGEGTCLQGASYYAQRPTAGKGKMAASINKDMYLPLHKVARVIGYALDAPSLAAPMRAAAKEFAVELPPVP